MQKLSPEEVREFIIETLQVSGASYREVGQDLLLAEVTVEIPPQFFNPARLEKHTLNLVFTPEAGAAYPGSELVVPGSYRLSWFLEGLRKRGNFTLQHFLWRRRPEELQAEIEELQTKGAPKKERTAVGPTPKIDWSAPEVRMRPYLLANFTLSYRTDELWEELLSLGLDMVSGEITPKFLPLLSAAEAVAGIPAGEIQTPQYSMEEAFTLFQEAVQRWALSKEGRWIEEARQRYEEELYCLYQYYHDDRREKVDFEHRARELYDQFRPRVLVQLVNLGLIYLPEVSYPVVTPTGRKQVALYYLPLLKKIIYPSSTRGTGSKSPK
ncbi:MAG: hypothetical protein GX050_06170 [Firmicutes bacterium]|nr:hypothetical protein [Bacillota bacterium]